ncbi:hypothetical protein [Tichowtungia aerotolerans]|uniref:Uncharacterized protein n=1 Tax=Tichowtungia aerotolerans TaxID=2697043 RepID=A0A6P1MC52_9BACT|nr:hypothetical protein [Tichowtungia aerotolerans]QHI69166.1 hypothetical protein GT409_06780 [Tichowtungia aerotolerans]
MKKQSIGAVLFIAAGWCSAFELITDNRFQTGLNALDPDTGAVEGEIQYTTANGDPAWKLAQWNSQASVYGQSPSVLQSGAYQWANLYKAIVMGPTNTADSDLKLTVNSINEHNGVYQTNNDERPAMLVSQKISEPNGHIGVASPWISEMTELNFNVDAKLCYANHIYTNGYNSLIHAAQFLVYFTVQNLNTSSLDYGEYLWFGLRLYDDRVDLPGLAVKEDIGTGKLIYNIGIEPFCTNGLALGAWKNISGDLLPYVEDALDAAWQLGYLTNSMTYNDYKIGAMNMGWEVPGLSCVAMQVKNFGLETYGLYFPKPYEFNVNGDREDWAFANLTEVYDGPYNGVWIFTASQSGPQLIGPEILVDAEMYPKVIVKMANAGNPAAASVAQLFWKCTGDTSFSEARSKKVNIGNGGGWVEYTFDMTNDPDWHDEIIQLRLDPIYYGDGHAVGIDYIRFSE